MKSLYDDSEAQAYSERFRESGTDLALRVYTSRLIGGEPRLVMHGGGNTSVKSSYRTLLGDELEAIFVKGSGWNLDSIEPPGFPALDLSYLRRLRRLERMTDEEMVNELRTHLFDAASPNPSVETLLHAFLPHKFVDHSHAEAILTLTNQPEGRRLVREALGEEVPVVRYVMPGFELAKVAADVAEAHPGCIGLVLDKHGLFTFGDSARESYERHIDLVSRAERHASTLSEGRRAVVTVDYDAEEADRRAARLAPLLRGALRELDPEQRHWVVEPRSSELVWSLVHSDRLEEIVLGPPLTPDHVIRTKGLPLVLRAPEDDLDSWRHHLTAEMTRYAEVYEAYFSRNVERTGRQLRRLDPLPRIILVEKGGLFCVGGRLQDARIAGDLYEATVDVKTLAPVLGRYEGLPEEDLFDVEYWSLEQAKLGGAKEKPLQRKVALVTGAGGAIGAAVVRHLLAEGACVVAGDVADEALERLRDRLGTAVAEGRCRTVLLDVADEGSVRGAFELACRAFGGVDIVICNAGIAASAPLEELSVETWRRVLEVNLTGYFTTLREAARIMKTQGTGGDIVVNASKNVFAPGAEFAAYSSSKAGGLQLAKVAAIELAPFDIRVNMINPDAVFSDGDIPSGLWQDVGAERARARGLDLEGLEDYYRQRNLLKARITADDVARAVLFFARRETPTTGATLPVDGGIPAAFPR